MEIKDFLQPANVLIGLRVSDKIGLLQDLSKRAASELGIDAELVASAILKREELGSTGMGGGVALPHARMQEVKKPFGILARLRKEIDFAAIDAAPVDLFFLLLLPASSDGDQLNALAAVARRLRNPEIADALRTADDAAQMYNAIVGR